MLLTAALTLVSIALSQPTEGTISEVIRQPVPARQAPGAVRAGQPDAQTQPPLPPSNAPAPASPGRRLATPPAPVAIPTTDTPLPPLTWAESEETALALPDEAAPEIVTDQDRRFDLALAAALADQPGCDVVILLDRSASMIGHWAWVQQDIRAALHLLGDRRVTLVAAASRELTARVDSDGQASATAALAETVDKLRPAGNSDLADALGRVRQLTEKPQPCLVLLFSDGLSTDSNPVQACRQLTADGDITVCTFYYGSQVPRGVRVLTDIAQAGGGTFTNVTRP